LLAVSSRSIRHLPTVDHEAVVDLWELFFLVALLIVVALILVIFCRGPSLIEVTPEHVAVFKGVLDGTPVLGARLLENLVEHVAPPPPERSPRIPALGNSDEICVNGVAFCLRLLLGILLRARLDGRLGDIFLLPSLRRLVFPEDGFDRLLTRGELGGYIHQFACLGGSLASQFAYQVPASGADEECSDDVRVGDVRQLGALL
jgi:hypothetical protein